MSREKSIFLISPVRDVTEEEMRAVEDYVIELEEEGNDVHWPYRDTDQDDPYGLDICEENRKAIDSADEVHVYWTSKSQGSIFDLGMAFGMSLYEDKPIRLVNDGKFELEPPKSFTNVLKLLELDYRKD
jgi:hypothetical protein